MRYRMVDERVVKMKEGGVHKVLKYKEHHSVCPLVGIGSPPTPLLQASVPPPRTKGCSGAHLPTGKGLGESQFRRLEKKSSTLPPLWGRYFLGLTLIHIGEKVHFS
jgi:hypothetical protein